MAHESAEQRALCKFLPDLTDFIQHNIITTLNRLLEKGLVTSEVHDYVLTAEGVSSQQKAARTVSCMINMVGNSAKRFNNFVEVMETVSFPEDTLKRIIAEYSNLK